MFVPYDEQHDDSGLHDMAPATVRLDEGAVSVRTRSRAARQMSVRTRLVHMPGASPGVVIPGPKVQQQTREFTAC